VEKCESETSHYNGEEMYPLRISVKKVIIVLAAIALISSSAASVDRTNYRAKGTLIAIVTCFLNVDSQFALNVSYIRLQ
jgi:hypothetical protein